MLYEKGKWPSGNALGFDSGPTPHFFLSLGKSLILIA